MQNTMQSYLAHGSNKSPSHLVESATGVAALLAVTLSALPRSVLNGGLGIALEPAPTGALHAEVLLGA